LGCNLLWSSIFNPIVSTFHDWFWGKKMRPHGLQVSSSTLMLLCRPLSAQWSYLAWSEVDCSCTLCNQTLRLAMNVIYASKKCSYFITNKIPCFLCCLTLFYISITGIFKFLEPNRPSTPKMDSDVCDGSVSRS
jgi:hypothetical protein